ncbi:MAG TPA: oligosaccharide flippase family protein, partial [Burkholderiaceae bacterium]|nr:oligosaccharide flippase family protein [Burkholderiaceae bacterium]
VASGLLVAQLAGALAALAMLVLAMAPADRVTSPRAGRAELAAAARAHADAPRYLWPAALLDTFTQQLPLVLIAAWYSQALAGQFSLAWRMLAVPLFMLSAAAASVFYQRMATLADRPREARALLLGSWRLFAGVGALPALVVMLWGEPLFVFVFGTEWAAAGRIAAVLMPMLWAMFVSAPTSSALIVLGLQRWSVVFGLAMLVVRPLAFWIGAQQGRLETGLWAWVGGELLLIAGYNLLILRRLRET